ncbi:MAG: PD-(D/E)XK nuclease family protein [Clostridia bacterium]|nr:PD-(D/E)XK nuclease family protein [Clostridia bacterium]
MAAKITFITGRSGAGKSRRVRRIIGEKLNEGARVALIVPEQFTFETERQLSEEFGGLMDVSVYSFTTLARKVLKGRVHGFLSRQGRRMAVRKVITEQGKNLSIFARVQDSPGFAASCDELFTMCKRFEVTPEQLKAAAEDMQAAAPLKGKLSELALLYSETESYLRGRYMDTEDIFAALKAALPESFIKDSYVIIDGFDLLTVQLYGLMEAMMDTAPGMAITFRVDNGRDERVFAPERRAYARLYAKAQEKGCDTEVIRLPDEQPSHRAPALMHLEKEAFAYPYNKFDGSPEGIRLFAGRGMGEECAWAAEQALAAAREGIRYRDMAVVATDNAYTSRLIREFTLRGIPCFSDGARKLSAYPGARLILCALRCAERGYTLNCLTELIRTGMAGVSPEEGDIFENHCLEKGIRHTAFTKPFESETAEAVRKAVVEPIARLKNALVNGSSAALKAEAVFAYMEEMELHRRTAELADKLRSEGRHEQAEENAQVYRELLTVLDQLHAIMGEGKLSVSRFAAVFREGLDAYEINAIPATADQVLIGSVGRTRAREIKALFILGANEGSFPKYFRDDSLITDEELNRLGALGINKWDSSTDRGDVELMDVYCAIAKPTERLYISCAMSAGGDGALPAAVIDRMLDMFPGLTMENGIIPAAPESPESGMGALAASLRTMGDMCPYPEYLPELLAWYAARAQHHDALSRIEGALYHKASPEPFGHELSLRLYGDHITGSATRLERFNACPFRHFVLNGLGAAERKEYRERRVDEGSFCHAALEAFVERAMAGDIRALTDEDCERMVDELMPAIIAEHNGGVLMSSRRNLSIMARMTRRVKSTAKAIVRQTKAGEFSPERTEVRFGGEGLPPLKIELPTGEKFLIGGRIDRIDGCEIDGEKYYRIVDYKTGSASFDYTALYHGLKLQLPLYAAAIAAAEKGARAAGMYYMQVQDPVTDREEQIEKEIMKAFRLSGLTLSDPSVIAATAGDDPDNVVISTRGSKGIVDEGEFLRVMDYAKEKSAETLRRIYDGEADVSPARTGGINGTDICKTCESRSVCGFDTKLPGCRYRDLRTLDKDAFFSMAGKEGEHGLDR